MDLHLFYIVIYSETPLKIIYRIAFYTKEIKCQHKTHLTFCDIYGLKRHRLCVVVLSTAELKILITADAMTRAKRRHKQFIEKGKDISLEEVFLDIQDRDILDEKNMSKCPHQIVLDTTNMTITEQIDRVFKKIKNLS